MLPPIFLFRWINMASAIENFYSGPMLFERTNNIYVHFHARNIGKAAGGSAISAD